MIVLRVVFIWIDDEALAVCFPRQRGGEWLPLLCEAHKSVQHSRHHTGKQLILDFRIECEIESRAPVTIHQWRLKFLETRISDNLTLSVHTTTAVKKAQQILDFLSLCEKLLSTFYHTTIECILVYCVTVRYARKKAIQNMINNANNHWLFSTSSERNCKHKIPLQSSSNLHILLQCWPLTF